MSKQTECAICCEKYNLSNHKEVICLFSDCNFSNCKSCVQTYLLGTTSDPHCMNCNKGWEQKFLVSNLNRTFCEKEYKNHRKNLLVHREISKLPETMYLAERQKKIYVEQDKSKKIQEKIKALQQQVNTLKTERYTCDNNIYKIRHGNLDSNKEIQKFIMSCPNNNCRGYLSRQYKCELCKLFTCHDCLEIIGYTKTDPHTCNPDSILSAETIRKETKPCPSCGIRIFKISGCSQMWCTECKVAFDYNTGKIDSGTIHNPHYYNHMRQQNNGQAPRNPQDVVCGGLCSVYQLNAIYTKLKLFISDTIEQNTLINYIGKIHRNISHITHYDLPRIRQHVRQNNDHQDLRVNYILGNTDKKQMGIQIYKRDILRKKNTELLHLYELINVIGIESFNAIIQHRMIDNLYFLDLVNEKILILDNLRDYCNNIFAKISVTYNQKIINITDLWDIESKKYKIIDCK